MKMRRQHITNFEHSAEELAELRMECGIDSSLDLGLLQATAEINHALAMQALSKGSSGPGRGQLETLVMMAMQGVDDTSRCLGIDYVNLPVDDAPLKSILDVRTEL